MAIGPSKPTQTQPTAGIGRCRRIVLYGNSVLRQPAREVRDFAAGLHQLAADLLCTMLRHEGMGLAANQVGDALAVFAVNPQASDTPLMLTVEDGSQSKPLKDPCCIVNPCIVNISGRVESEEGCLSFPGLYEVVARPSSVVLDGFDIHGAALRVTATGVLARALVHETDHLRGVLFIDHLSPSRRRLLTDRLRRYEENEAQLARAKLTDGECG